jgi:tetratricopeptide (TPR) repeat protein
MKNSKEFIRAFRVPALGIVMIAGFVLALYGVWRLGSYSYPMLSENFQDAAQSSVGDPPVALYDFGVQAYKDGDPALAKDALTEAFNQLTKNTGVVPPNRKELAGRIQFMLGVVNEHAKQFRVAVTAYEDSLRLSPDNLDAKYNLERLKSQFPDIGKGGGGDPQNPGQQPSKGNSSNKKGI